MEKAQATKVKLDNLVLEGRNIQDHELQVPLPYVRVGVGCAMSETRQDRRRCVLQFLSINIISYTATPTENKLSFIREVFGLMNIVKRNVKLSLKPTLKQGQEN